MVDNGGMTIPATMGRYRAETTPPVDSATHILFKLAVDIFRLSLNV